MLVGQQKKENYCEIDMSNTRKCQSGFTASITNQMKMDLWEEIGEAECPQCHEVHHGKVQEKVNLISLAKITHNKRIMKRKKVDLHQ